MPRELDSKVGTLEDSDESNGPNILYPGIIDALVTASYKASDDLP